MRPLSLTTLALLSFVQLRRRCDCVLTKQHSALLEQGIEITQNANALQIFVKNTCD